MKASRLGESASGTKRNSLSGLASCLLLGVKQTSLLRALMSANDPQRKIKSAKCSKADFDRGSQRPCEDRQSSHMIIMLSGASVPPSE